MKIRQSMVPQWCIDVDDELCLHPTQLSRKSTKEEIELIVKAVNNHDRLVKFVVDVLKLSSYKANHDTILYDFREINKKATELLNHLESNPLK